MSSVFSVSPGNAYTSSPPPVNKPSDPKVCRFAGGASATSVARQSLDRKVNHITRQDSSVVSIVKHVAVVLFLPVRVIGWCICGASSITLKIIFCLFRIFGSRFSKSDILNNHLAQLDQLTRLENLLDEEIARLKSSDMNSEAFDSHLTELEHHLDVEINELSFSSSVNSDTFNHRLAELEQRLDKDIALLQSKAREESLLE